jgi:hypothetical protein
MRIGLNEQIPYSKVDLSKAIRLNDNIAISCYQFDYQAVAIAMSPAGTIPIEEIKPMPVAKIVMDYGAFKQLLKELNSLNEKMEKEDTEIKG